MQDEKETDELPGAEDSIAANENTVVLPMPAQPEKKAVVGISGDPYEWGQCTITAQIVWSTTGIVMLGVRNHLDAPMIAVLGENDLSSPDGSGLPLPKLEAIAGMLEALREDLPRRAEQKVAHDAAEARKKTEAKAPSRKVTSVPAKTSTPASTAKVSVPARTVGKAPDVAQKSFFELFTGA